MERYFWAWKKLTRREENIATPSELTDQAFIGAVISAIVALDIPEGDGKFSRVETYAKTVRTEIEWCRRNWKGSDETLTAFFLGVEAMCTELERIIEKIKKGR